MNQIVLAVIYIVAGAFLGQVIRKYYNSAKLREQAAQAAIEASFKYVHGRVDDLHTRLESELNRFSEHFHERVKSTESSIDANTRLLESHAKQLAGDVKSDVKAAGKKI